ncbi:hypothetical protein CgunFtcFv8_026770 [Champsocephalus gunnari]|uniref:Uncharacterized protein n=1 Tax=Champsocephalus gunnari TaxID=52237 RepID=A0AAN8HVM3_CHAGU|nr:hypothetical protein CgunFtcFv8_026770 [Champsocephalus gunnari]
MDDAEGDLVAGFISSVLPNSSTNELVLEALQQMGVDTLEDLKYLIEANLKNVMRPIDARKLIASVKALSENDAIDDLPSSPCIVVCGSSPLTAGHFMVAVDQTIVNGSVPNVVDALILMFAAYYCLNISYPTELGGTLEFLHRCLFKINPDKATKRERKASKKQQSVNPKVLSLITNIADFEWRE